MKVASTFFDEVEALLEAMPESFCVEPHSEARNGEVLCETGMDLHLLKFYTLIQKIQEALAAVRQNAEKAKPEERARVLRLLENDDRKVQLLKMRFAADAGARHPELLDKPLLVVRKGRRIGWKVTSSRVDVVSVSIS